MAGKRQFRSGNKPATSSLHPQCKGQQLARGLHGKHIDSKDLTVLVAQKVARMRIANEQITPRIEEEMSVTNWLEAEFFHERGDFFTLRPSPDDKRLGDSDAWTCGIIHKTDDAGILAQAAIGCRSSEAMEKLYRKLAD